MRKAVVEVPYSGSRLIDWRRAEQAVRELFEDPAWTRPRGWTWHHLGDGHTLQLVPARLHGSLPHTGLAAVGTSPPASTPPGLAASPRLGRAASSLPGRTASPLSGRAPSPLPGRAASPLPLQEPGPPLAPGTIERVERILEVPLPVEYARMLKAANGGRPRVAAFHTASGQDEAVDRFLSVGSGDEDDMIAWLQSHAERLPAGFLPIAYDPFGNLIGLDLRPEAYGQVLFWDHELEPEGEEDERSNVRLVAADFTAFLGSFFLDEPRPGAG